MIKKLSLAAAGLVVMAGCDKGLTSPNRSRNGADDRSRRSQAFA